MAPEDRLICAAVNQLALHQEFKTWPLHLTIVPWFRMPEPSEDLAAELQSRLAGIEPFMVAMGEQTTLGHNKTVNLVQEPTPLHRIWREIVEVLDEHQAWQVDKTTKRHHSYRPHVSQQQAERLHEGESFWCARLYIIEQLGGRKRVAGIVELGRV